MDFLKEAGVDEESFVIEDSIKLQSWYGLIKERDHYNVKNLLITAYNWSKETVKLGKENRILLSAIASTIRGKVNYRDIDFLLLSSLNDYILFEHIGKLEKALQENFFTSISYLVYSGTCTLEQNEIPKKVKARSLYPGELSFKRDIDDLEELRLSKEEYFEDLNAYVPPHIIKDPHAPIKKGTGARAILLLRSKTHGAPINLTIQPGFKEKEWDKIEEETDKVKYGKVKIFRI